MRSSIVGVCFMYAQLVQSKEPPFTGEMVLKILDTLRMSRGSIRPKTKAIAFNWECLLFG